MGIALVVLAAAVLVLLAILARRSLLRRPGTFACSLRQGSSPGDGVTAPPSGRGWSYGVARYHGDRLEWFRLFSFSPRPRHVLLRRELRLRARRDVEPAEMHAVPPGALVVTCTLVQAARSSPTADLAGVELAMSRDAMTGFLSWVEATSPGGPMVT